MFRISSLLIAIGLLSACKKSSDDDKTPGPTTTVPGPGPTDTTTVPTPKPDTATVTPTPTPPVETETARPTDPQILAIAMTVHQIEIDAAKIAQKMAKGDDAKAFAQMMLDDHGKGQEKGQALADKLGLKLEDTEQVTMMKKDAEETATRLQATEGEAFDHAYLEAMTKGHQKVLGMIDEQLVPNATSPELKTYLEEWRPGVAKHLEHAQQGGGMTHPPS